MSKERKTQLIKYGASAGFVALMVYVYISLRDFAGVELTEKFRMLSDAFTIPGVLLIMAGAMVWSSNQGALDGLGYVTSTMVRGLIPGGRAKADERYADYVERKRNNPVRGFSFLFLTGGITIAISLVFLALLYLI